MAFDFDLESRKSKDYEGQLVNRIQGLENRRQAAVTVAYMDIIRTVAKALGRKQSVLVCGGSMLARSFVNSIQRLEGFQDDDFEYFSVEDAFSRNPIHRSEGSVEHPSRKMLTDSFQLFIRKDNLKERIGVVDFLDAFFSVGGGEDQLDLLYLLAAYPGQQLLGFAHSDTYLPAALLARFSVQIRLPPLNRETLWSMLAYEEVQNLFGATKLSIGHQIALYHTVSGMDALQFRLLVEALIKEDSPPESPYEVMRKLKRWRAPGTIVSEITEPSCCEEWIATLRKEVLIPFQRYFEPHLTNKKVTELDAQIPTGITATGSGSQARALSHWFAGELEANYITTTGAALTNSGDVFSRSQPLPLVIFIQDFNQGLLAGGEPLRACLAAWSRFEVTEPVFVFAHLESSDKLPLFVQCKFSLQLSL